MNESSRIPQEHLFQTESIKPQPKSTIEKLSSLIKTFTIDAAIIGGTLGIVNIGARIDQHLNGPLLDTLREQDNLVNLLTTKHELMRRIIDNPTITNACFGTLLYFILQAKKITNDVKY